MLAQRRSSSNGAFEMNEDNNIPTAYEIVQAVTQLPDFTPMAELAKAVCMIGTAANYPYNQVMVAGCYMPAWKAKIVEAQFMAFLSPRII